MSPERQCTNSVFVVRPCRFQSNPLTAASNAFQAAVPWDDLTTSNRIAQQQFDGFVERLVKVGINCIVFDDTPEPHTPDSVFPNNWISMHADGSLVLFPMEAPNRRVERRDDIVRALETDHGFLVRRRIDLTHYEQHARFLEGTGSLVLDRVNRVAYACTSSRTDAGVAQQFADRLGYELLLFQSVDASGQPIYHSNVMMFVGATVAVVCSESVAARERHGLLQRLQQSGHEVVDIGFAQLEAFAGNMLELVAGNGDPIIALSQQALDSLAAAQRKRLEAHALLVPCAIDHIETQSGGSVRCMLAEIHLPQRSERVF